MVISMRLCKIEGCGRKHFGKGYCQLHYERIRRNGTIHIFPVENYGGRYRLVRMPGHQLANAQGKVFVHRLNLFNKIGPGIHLCNWCNREVSWNKSWPESDDALIVDHRDRNNQNNSPDNLVPSCHGCNVSRPRTIAAAMRMIRKAIRNGSQCKAN